MSTRQYRPSRVRPLILPLFCLNLLGYFSYHAWAGDYGLVAHGKLSQQLVEVEMDLDTLQDERKKLAHLISLYDPKKLDPDLIEERARVSLSMIAPDELIILLPEDF